MINLPSIRGLEASYYQYVCNYRQFLKMRGYGDHVNDWIFVKRSFLECWLQPGFHRFWQIWNPGIGYFAYKMYLSCGGKNRQNLATFATFLVNGLVHNLLGSMILRRWDFPLPFTFSLLGIFTIVSRWLDSYINMSKWPKILHLALNLGLIILSFDFGFRVNEMLPINL